MLSNSAYALNSNKQTIQSQEQIIRLGMATISYQIPQQDQTEVENEQAEGEGRKMQQANSQTRLKSNKRIIYSSSKLKKNSPHKNRCKTYESTKPNQQLNEQQQCQKEDEQCMDYSNTYHIAYNNNTTNIFNITYTGKGCRLKTLESLPSRIEERCRLLNKESVDRGTKSIQAVYSQLYSQQSVVNTYINSSKSTLAKIYRNTTIKRHNPTIESNLFKRDHGTSHKIYNQKIGDACDYEDNIQWMRKKNIRTNRLGTLTSTFMGAIKNININLDYDATTTSHNTNTNRQLQANKITSINTSRNKQGQVHNKNRYLSNNKKKDLVHRYALFNNKILKSSIKQRNLQNFIQSKVEVLKTFYLDRPEIKIKEIRRNKPIDSTPNKNPNIAISVQPKNSYNTIYGAVSKNKANNIIKNGECNNDYIHRNRKNYNKDCRNKKLVNPNIFNIYKPSSSIIISLESNLL